MAYVRPKCEIKTYVDDFGVPIQYGQRWREVGPPEWAYQSEAHPERFEPVLAVAAALIDHLTSTYRVEIRREDTSVTLLPHGGGAPLRVECDTSTVTATVSAGYHLEQSFPACGCDACDDDVGELLDELEHLLFAVVNGGLCERYTFGRLTVSVADSERSWRPSRSERQGGRAKLRGTRRWEPWLVR